MEVGMSVPWTGPLASPDAIVAVARQAEAAGFGYLQVGDHAMYPSTIESRYPYSPTGVMPTGGIKLDLFTVLSFVAANTSTIHLVAGVYLLALRSPIASARAVASLDFLSHGRVRLGVGAGWMQEEYDILGVPFGERGRIMDEHLAVLRHLFEGDGSGFEGRYVSFPPLAFEPRPVQQPLPILIGGGESPAVLRRIARFGDGWIPGGMTPAEVAAAMPAVRAALEGEGRRADDVRVYGRVGKVDASTASAGEVLSGLRALADAGCVGALVDLGETTGSSLSAVQDAVAWFAERVIPQASELEAVRS
jgi:probable F420-dependent oxidoreductase